MRNRLTKAEQEPSCPREEIRCGGRREAERSPAASWLPTEVPRRRMARPERLQPRSPAARAEPRRLEWPRTQPIQCGSRKRRPSQPSCRMRQARGNSYGTRPEHPAGPARGGRSRAPPRRSSTPRRAPPPREPERPVSYGTYQHEPAKGGMQPFAVLSAPDGKRCQAPLPRYLAPSPYESPTSPRSGLAPSSLGYVAAGPLASRLSPIP